MKIKNLVVVLSAVVIASALLLASRLGRGNPTVDLQSLPQVGGVQTEEIPKVKDLTPDQAQALISKNQVVIIDVRTPQEYSQGHLENAVNFDFSSANFESKISGLDKSKSYLLYCQSGRRSKAASEVVKSLGFGEVYNLLGGIAQWQAINLPVVK